MSGELSSLADDVTVRPLGAHDEAGVLGLLTAALAGGPTGDRTPEFFRWKHRDNPFGASPGLVAVDHDGQILAVRLFMRWEFVRGPRTVRAVRAVDTATRPDAQGRGLFRLLTGRLLDEVAKDTDLVFNTPNENSLPGYLTMGWSEVGKVPISLHPIRPLAFAKGLRELRAKKKNASDGVQTLDPETDAVQEQAMAADVSARCRFPTARQFFDDPVASAGLGELADTTDAADARAWPDRLRTRMTEPFLRWRYAAPGIDYRVIAAYRNGQLDGVAFGRPRLRGTLAEFTLSQVLVRPGDRDTARRLLSAAGMSRCDHVATHLAPGSDSARAARAAGYATPPRTGMLLTARPFDGFDLDVSALSAWHFALGDLEVF